jgi:hypothetical protein
MSTNFTRYKLVRVNDGQKEESSSMDVESKQTRSTNKIIPPITETQRKQSELKEAFQNMFEEPSRVYEHLSEFQKLANELRASSSSSHKSAETHLKKDRGVKEIPPSKPTVLRKLSKKDKREKRKADKKVKDVERKRLRSQRQAEKVEYKYKDQTGEIRTIPEIPKLWKAIPERKKRKRKETRVSKKVLKPQVSDGISDTSLTFENSDARSEVPEEPSISTPIHEYSDLDDVDNDDGGLSGTTEVLNTADRIKRSAERFRRQNIAFSDKRMFTPVRFPSQILVGHDDEWIVDSDQNVRSRNLSF